MSTTDTTIDQTPQESATPEPERRSAVPRWFVRLYYCIIVPFCILAAIYIGHSMIVQGRLTSAIDVLEGVEQEPTPEQQQQAVKNLATRPVFSFQYLNQSLLQDKDTDPRMARALALRKALDWGEIYRRRMAIQQILSVMEESGEIPRGELGIDWEGREVLRRLIDERQALSEPTPAEERITEVLIWIYRERPTRPGGLEARRMKALQDAYQKRGFAPVEAKALEAVMADWRASGEPKKEEAADKFEQILASQVVDPSTMEIESLTFEGELAEFVRQQMVEFENAYERGMARIGRAARTMVNMINGPASGTEGASPVYKGYELEAPDEKLFVDHPHIYQYASLLGYRYEFEDPEKFEDVRQFVMDGVYALRHRKFMLYFLRYFGRKTAINPVMAVETPRLTKEQHEREMREANWQRVRNAQKLMVRVFKDYLKNAEEYLDEEDAQFDTLDETDDYVRAKLVHPMQDLVEDPTFGEHARERLAEMREAARQYGKEDIFFGATAE